MIINKQDVLNHSMDYVKSLTKNPENFHADGPSVYKFLSYMSYKFNYATLIELGTRHGYGALALSTNSKNEVISYDINNFPNRPDGLNLTYVIKNIIGTDKDMEILLNSTFIFLDVDPHDGGKESIVYKYLVKHDYDGILMMDDMNHLNRFPGLYKYWRAIDHPNKYDVSDFGCRHAAGAGLILVGRLQLKINVIKIGTKVNDGDYIGRPSVLGNPFVIGVDGSRNDVVNKYEDWFLKRVKIDGHPVRNEIIKLYRKLRE